MLYNTGTIAINGNTATGTGTNWTAPASQVRAGQTIIVMSNPVQLFQISSVNSATSLTVTPVASPALSGQKYGILVSDNISVDGLAQAMSQLIKEYDENIGAWETFATTSANQTITVTINGASVNIPGIGALARKGANSDITELKGLTTALSIAQGGTGATKAEDARTNLGLGTFVTQEDQSIVYGPSRDHALVVRKDEWGVVVSDNGNPVPLGTRYGGTGATTGDYWGACTNIGAIRQKTARFAPGDTPTNIYWKNSTGFITGQVEGGALGAWIDITSADEAARMQLIGFYGDNNGKRGFGYKVYNPNSQSWYNLAVVRDTSNTTVDSNGFIKIASPIVKIYGDGRYETNDESEGVTVTRLDVGQYLIDGCESLNSDAAWGGIDGGFEIPTDRNKQPLIWLDYEVNADGSVLVKTYHRTHPDAPAFARNEQDGVSNGDPVDIPRDQFVSVRVEMPADSLYNQKLRAAEQALITDTGE
ncbi:TPA: phage tail protein [Escherichia coli]|uniref:phage tail fiber protein n=1 Tax=Escherichia coli TaxID=562 RepID=UPI00106CFA0C|nr:phage tail protein [Escherichia coli]MDZ6430175.1 phage tail protein [Escherichia coli]MDZ6440844.1 phage tail protein [Escherichia coli]MEB3697854.1 phage tail protein [Escherichia coli]HAY4529882.1 phage tail protein [Escherichia coli]HAY4581637.1 phage tail protein [Escherichia coli]